MYFIKIILFLCSFGVSSKKMIADKAIITSCIFCTSFMVRNIVMKFLNVKNNLSQDDYTVHHHISKSLSMIPIKLTIVIIVYIYIICLYLAYINNNKILIIKKEEITPCNIEVNIKDNSKNSLSSYSDFQVKKETKYFTLTMQNSIIILLFSYFFCVFIKFIILQILEKFIFFKILSNTMCLSHQIDVTKKYQNLKNVKESLWIFSEFYTPCINEFTCYIFDEYEKYDDEENKIEAQKFSKIHTDFMNMMQKYLYDDPIKTNTSINKVSLEDKEKIMPSLNEFNQFIKAKTSNSVVILFNKEYIYLSHYSFKEYIILILIDIKKMFNIFKTLYKSYKETQKYHSNIQDQIKSYINFVELILLLALMCWFCLIIFDYIILNKIILNFLISFVDVYVVNNTISLYMIINANKYIIIILILCYIIDLYEVLNHVILYHILLKYGHILILFCIITYISNYQIGILFIILHKIMHILLMLLQAFIIEKLTKKNIEISSNDI